MPMIDVYAPSDLFPPGTDGKLGKDLTMAVLRAEGVAVPGPFHLNNTAAFIHRMDPHAIHTAATDSARTVRVQVVTPRGALSREGQKQLVKEVTELVTNASGDPSQASRTWVILTEAAEGGWGLSGLPSDARSSLRSVPRRRPARNRKINQVCSGPARRRGRP
jgi:phenylpyruvate tautomerase PptA (4-oxalocrotonate tautomerase family)